MHLIQTLLGVVRTQPNRPGRATALEYSLVSGLALGAAVVVMQLMLDRVGTLLGQLPF